jgi:hypothetical protein
MFLVDTHDRFDKIIRIPNIVVDEEHAIILVSGLEDFVPLVYIGVLWKPMQYHLRVYQHLTQIHRQVSFLVRELRFSKPYMDFIWLFGLLGQ